MNEETLGEETMTHLRERGTFRQMEDTEYIEFLEAVIDHVYNAGGTPETETCIMCKSAYELIHYKRLPDNWEVIKAKISKHYNKLHIGSDDTEPQVTIAEHISRTPSPVTGIEPLHRCTECGSTENLVECFAGAGRFWCCRSCERKMREELS